MKVSEVKNYIDGRSLAKRKHLDLSQLKEQDLPAAIKALDSKLGVNFAEHLRVFDAATVGSPQVANGALPFNLLSWLPGAVKQITTVRKIDEVAGITTVGDWSDEDVVQRAITFSGDPQLYGDATNIPLANYSPDYITRKVVRYELGTGVGKLASARAARNGDNPEEYSRDAVFESLEINRNLIGFFGFDNGGISQTFGVFNDPLLSAYVTLPANSGGHIAWRDKNFNEITDDMALIVNTLVLSSGGHIDDNSAMTMILPMSCNQYLSKRNEIGSLSVKRWIEETYPNLRIVLVPEADGVNGGLNVTYIFADSIPNSGSDNGSIIEQIVPAKLMALNVEVKPKITIEDYLTATAGVIIKRPYAIARFTGL